MPMPSLALPGLGEGQVSGDGSGDSLERTGDLNAARAARIRLMGGLLVLV